MNSSLLLVVLATIGRSAGVPETQKAVFAGGCFWGVDAVFRHVQGVVAVVSGYAGGSAGTAQYDMVSTGTTGHAEAVEVTFDPQQISYAKLLEVFFTVAHDPTQLNRQGPDIGTQYRSAIFHVDDAQRQTAHGLIERLTRANAFPAPIVTEVVALETFYPAEAYHQDYYKKNPVRYQVYRYGCGRDQRLEELWGAAPK